MQRAADDAHDGRPPAASARETAWTFPSKDREKDRRRAGADEERPQKNAEEERHDSREKRGIGPDEPPRNQLRQLFPGEPVGSESVWSDNLVGPIKTVLPRSESQMKLAILDPPPGPTWSYTMFNFDTDGCAEMLFADTVKKHEYAGVAAG